MSVYLEPSTRSLSRSMPVTPFCMSLICEYSWGLVLSCDGVCKDLFGFKELNVDLNASTILNSLQ